MESSESKWKEIPREGEDRQIKEGAIRPVDNPDDPPPSTIEVTPADPGGGSEPDTGNKPDDGEAGKQEE